MNVGAFALRYYRGFNGMLASFVQQESMNQVREGDLPISDVGFATGSG